MNLTLIDQLILLALDDDKGVFVIDDTTLSYAISGAIILELALENKLDISGDIVKVIDRASTGDPILDKFISKIYESKKERKIRNWVDMLSRDAQQVKKDTLDRLIDNRILEKREDKILWIFQVDKFPTQNPRPENKLRSRLRDIVVDHHRPDLKEVMILNLVESCRLEREVFGKENAKIFKKEMKRIKEEDHLSQVVNKSIKDICDAVNAMLVILITTAVTTSVATS